MERVNFKVQNQNKTETFIDKPKTEIIKESKPEYTIVKTQLQHGNYEKGYTNWHQHCQYECIETKTIIKISDSIAGCGVQHLYGWFHYQDKKGIIETLKYCIKDLNSGVGFVTCQVGNKFEDSLLVKGLLELGFIDNQYSNYQHCKDGLEIGHFYTLRIVK